MRAALVLLLICAAAAADSAPAPALAPHVRFFAESFDVPMRTFYEIIGYSKECVRRAPKECGNLMRQAQHGGPIEMDPELLDLGPTHAAARASAPKPVFGSTQQALRKMSALMSRLESEAQAYDLLLYARGAAVISACSGIEDEGLHALASMYRADVLHFQRRSDSSLDQELGVLESQRRTLARSIQQQWPRTTCDKALALNRRLQASLWRRVKPVYADDSKPLPAEERQALVFGQIWSTAAELAREHDPAVAARLDAYEHQGASPR